MGSPFTSATLFWPPFSKIDSIPKNDMAKFPWLVIARSWGLGSAEVLKSHQILETAEVSGVIWAHVILPDERGGWISGRLLSVTDP